METLVVRPKDENQLAAIKAFTQALNIDFEKQEERLPDYVLTGVKQSRLEAEEGKLSEFRGISEMLR